MRQVHGKEEESFGFIFFLFSRLVSFLHVNYQIRSTDKGHEINSEIFDYTRHENLVRLGFEFMPNQLIACNKAQRSQGP